MERHLHEERHLAYSKRVAGIILLFLPALTFVVRDYSIIVGNRDLEFLVVQID